MGKSSSDRGRSRSAPALPFAGPCDLDEVCMLWFEELARMRFIGAAERDVADDAAVFGQSEMCSGNQWGGRPAMRRCFAAGPLPALNGFMRD